MLSLTDLDAAYLAGLMDGEGTIGYRPQKSGYPNIELGICMTTPAPLHWAAAATGLGKVYHRPESRANRRDAWFWKVSVCQDIAEILRRIRPYMLVKQYEASAFLIVALLREYKPYVRAPSPYKEGEQMAGALVQKMKEWGWEHELYEECLDLACYLRQAIEERDNPA
jgi:hypothetical protein